MIHHKIGIIAILIIMIKHHVLLQTTIYIHDVINEDNPYLN